jgi:hypothetical protein
MFPTSALSSSLPHYASWRCAGIPVELGIEKNWVSFSAIKGRVRRSLPVGETLFPKRRLLSLGALEHLFVEESSISVGNRDGGPDKQKGRRSAISTCRNCPLIEDAIISKNPDAAIVSWRQVHSAFSGTPSLPSRVSKTKTLAPVVQHEG